MCICMTYAYLCNQDYGSVCVYITVGELRSGVTGFATIYATGSHRFMLLVRNDERDEFNLRQKKNGEFDLSLAHACYRFSFKYHRALSDF